MVTCVGLFLDRPMSSALSTLSSVPNMVRHFVACALACRGAESYPRFNHLTPQGGVALWGPRAPEALPSGQGLHTG